MKNILKANVGRSVNLPKGQLFSKRWENEKRILKQILFFVFLARVRETARDTPLIIFPAFLQNTACTAVPPFLLAVVNFFGKKMEDENLNFSCGEGEERIERKLKKGQVNAERLAQMFGVSHRNICKKKFQQNSINVQFNLLQLYISPESTRAIGQITL